MYFFSLYLGYKIFLFCLHYSDTCPSQRHMISFHDNHTAGYSSAQSNHDDKLGE